MPNKLFLNLDLESRKLVLNFDLSFIWEILEFGTKVSSQIRGVQFLNKILELFQSVLSPQGVIQFFALSKQEPWRPLLPFSSLLASH